MVVMEQPRTLSSFRSRVAPRFRFTGMLIVVCLTVSLFLSIFVAKSNAVVFTSSGQRYGVEAKTGVAPQTLARKSNGGLGTFSAVLPTNPIPFDSVGNMTWHGGYVMDSGYHTYTIYWDPSHAFTASTKNLI